MKKLIITLLIISALGALAGCSNTDSSISVTTPSSTSITTTTTSASATSQSEEPTTTTTTSDTETQMPTETSQTERETSSNTESVSSVQESSSATTTTTAETEETKPAVTTTSTQGTTSKVTTTTKKQTTTTKAVTTTATTTKKPAVTTSEEESLIGEVMYARKDTPLFSKASEDSTTVCTIAAYTKFKIIGYENEMYKIQTNNKKLTGYVYLFIPVSTTYGQPVNTIEDISLYDDECFRLMNEHRKSLGLPELIQSSELQRAADIRADELAEQYSHYRPNGEYFTSIFEELGIEYDSYRGEIICSGASLPNEAIDAWINSPDHYQHMISTSYDTAACSHNGYEWIIVLIKE